MRLPKQSNWMQWEKEMKMSGRVSFHSNSLPRDTGGLLHHLRDNVESHDSKCKIGREGHGLSLPSPGSLDQDGVECEDLPEA